MKVASSIFLVFESTGNSLRGKEEKSVVEDGKTGVPPKVRKMGEALALGKSNGQQIPEEVLTDFELVISEEEGADICSCGRHAHK